MSRSCQTINHFGNARWTVCPGNDRKGRGAGYIVYAPHHAGCARSAVRLSAPPEFGVVDLIARA